MPDCDLRLFAITLRLWASPASQLLRWQGKGREAYHSSIWLERVVALGEMLVGLLNSPTTQQPWYLNTTYLDAVDKVLKISAVVFGAVWTVPGAAWTFLKYVRESALTHRLRLRISGRIVERDNEYVLFGSALIKNVGRSKLRIERRGSGLIVNRESVGGITNGVFELDPRMEDRILVTDVVSYPQEIVPGDLIEHPFAVRLGRLRRDVVAVRVRIRVVAQHRRVVAHYKVAWNALERFYVDLPRAHL